MLTLRRCIDLNAVNWQMTLKKISPADGRLSGFLQQGEGGQNLVTSLSGDRLTDVKFS